MMGGEQAAYRAIADEIRDQIASGALAPGAWLPSETELMGRYRVGRTTVVRALSILQAQHLIWRERGRGSFVRDRAGQGGGPRIGRDAIEASEDGDRITFAGWASVPLRLAEPLGMEPGERVALRQRLSLDHKNTPIELASLWVLPRFADGTDLISPDPLPGGIRAHLKATRGLRLDRVTERISARCPSTSEAEVLNLDPGMPVLVMVASVCDPAGVVGLAVELVWPSDLRELEDAYPLD